MTADARQVGREVIKGTVPAALWEQNWRFSRELVRAVSEHSMLRHPIIQAMGEGSFDFEAIKVFHLEFRHGFSQVFTDALIQAMSICTQLEPRLKAVGKMSSRFLLQLNLLDELGFDESGQGGQGLTGTPYNSHYVQFDQTLKQLGFTDEDLHRHVPSEAAARCRQAFESAYHDHTLLIAVMAVAETVFPAFARSGAHNVSAATDVDTDEGYHSIHVGQEAASIDDLHSDDLWYLLSQSVEPTRYDQVRATVRDTLDTWTHFLDSLYALRRTDAASGGPPAGEHSSSRVPSS